jgi:hypothetical protein
VETQTETLFTRPVPFIREVAEAGDRINMANADRPPYWQTLISVVACEDSPEDEGECPGECAFVLNLELGSDGEDGCDVTWWHVSWSEFDSIWTSLPAATR